MSSVFRNRIGLSFYETHVGEDLNICEAGYEQCRPTKPYEFIPIDYYAIHYCLRGEGIFQVQNNVQHIYPGDIFMIPPHTPNKYFPIPENPWFYRWVGVHGKAAQEILKGCGLTREHFCIRHQVNSELESYFEKVYIACKEKQDLKAIGNLYHLLDYIKNNQQDSLIPLLSQSEVHYNELLRYIHQHYFQDITIASMAADNNIDRTYIFKLFKKYKNTSPSQYLLEYRLDKACLLLMKTSLSITDISYAVGFQNAPYFSRQFTKQKGMTPSAYRKNFLKTGPA